MRQEALDKALALAGELDTEKRARLEMLCEAAFAALEMQLRDGLSPEDCREAFLIAVCLHALAAIEGFGEVSEFRAGDLTVKRGGSRKDAASRCLQRQADLIIQPFMKDSFSFVGV